MPCGQRRRLPSERLQALLAKRPHRAGGSLGAEQVRLELREALRHRELARPSPCASALAWEASLGAGNSSTLPAIGLSDTDGAAALAHVGHPATVVTHMSWPVSAYASYNGTSMAAPHVAGVAAAVWSCNPSWSNTQIRSALNATAEHLGTSGRDNSHGFGLVQAKAALDELLVGRSAEVCSCVFTGFLAPIDNGSVLNKMRAGAAVPVKFRLGGSHGLDIFAGDSPSSQTITCDTSAPRDAVEEVLTAGSSGLSYDAAADQYSYLWKTDREWAGSCRQLTVKLANGASHTANFIFTK